MATPAPGHAAGGPRPGLPSFQVKDAVGCPHHTHGRRAECNAAAPPRRGARGGLLVLGMGGSVALSLRPLGESGAAPLLPQGAVA